MLLLPKRLRTEIRSRARDEARWLLRDHGDEAEAVLAAKLRRPGLSVEFRLRYRFAEIELRKLRAAAQAPGRALMVYRPTALGLFRLLRGFGIRRARNRG